jgi:hypothetical protein
MGAAESEPNGRSSERPGGEGGIRSRQIGFRLALTL